LGGVAKDISEEDFIKEQSSISTFAVLKDGEWYERGSMGWWGCVSDEKERDKWYEEFEKLFTDLPADTRISIVDCHI
jgi:hypothetical protein